MMIIFCHEVNEKVLPILLEVWAVQNCITHNALRDLLCLLHKLHPNLPKDPRTLFSLSYEFTIIILLVVSIIILV